MEVIFCRLLFCSALTARQKQDKNSITSCSVSEQEQNPSAATAGTARTPCAGVRIICMEVKGLFLLKVWEKRQAWDAAVVTLPLLWQAACFPQLPSFCTRFLVSDTNIYVLSLTSWHFLTSSSPCALPAPVSMIQHFLLLPIPLPNTILFIVISSFIWFLWPHVRNSRKKKSIRGY